MFIEFARAQLPDLIRLVGTQHFVSGVMGAANRSVAPVDVFSLFHYDATAQPVNFGTASCVSEQVTRRTAERYVAGLGLHDPMRRTLEARDRCASPSTFYLHRDRIDHPAYREQCFVRTGTIDRMSVLCHGPQMWHSINFYRTHHSGPFQANELAAFAELAPLLASLVVKHVSLCDPSQSASTESPQARFSRRLRDRANTLSDRECEICSLILQGHTSESIALKLDLTVNTVLTYRKRAYSKLRIGTQNELFRICLD